ncbi:MAG: hypothetical protein IJ542_03695 [Clostridia bacterium]|nr:hypothetical protein [Clostridia bacterium]
MFELTISTTKSQEIADKLFDKIYTQTKCVCDLIVKHTVSKKYCVCLAFSVKHYQFVSAIILDAIADIIAHDYKFEYLSQSIYQFTENHSSFLKLINALVNFDNFSDKELVKNSILCSNYISIDSYYNFRMQNLKKRWKDIATIVNDNIEYMLLNNSLEDIIGYFNDAKSAGEVEVFCERNGIKISINGVSDDLYFYYSNDCYDLVANELISLEPTKLIFHGGDYEFETLVSKLPNALKAKTFRI